MNQPLVTQLARCEYVEHHENVIAIGNSGTGKAHVALGPGDWPACQTWPVGGLHHGTAALVNELMEARRRAWGSLNLHGGNLAGGLQLLIIDELGFVPLSHTGAELLFEVFSQRYERGSILVTTNLPFDEWTEVFGSERLTGALLDRLTHHVHILEMNGESYRLKGSRQRRRRAMRQRRIGRMPFSVPPIPKPATASRRGPHPTGPGRGLIEWKAVGSSMYMVSSCMMGSCRFAGSREMLVFRQLCGSVLLRPSGMFSLRR